MMYVIVYVLLQIWAEKELVLQANQVYPAGWVYTSFFRSSIRVWSLFQKISGWRQIWRIKCTGGFFHRYKYMNRERRQEWDWGLCYPQICEWAQYESVSTERYHGEQEERNWKRKWRWVIRIMCMCFSQSIEVDMKCCGYQRGVRRVSKGGGHLGHVPPPWA